ncbi:MAG: hypothetical protein O8C61_08665 [Candidatus Methanoperedens sp.]|nr:hypothetical protein [Candidatus Methanoperedens sp.]
MKEIRIIALMIALAIIQAGLILGGILPPLSVNSSVNTMFLLVRIAIIGYTGWIFSGIGFKEAAIKGGIVTFAAVITLYISIFIGITMHKPVLGISFTSQNFFFILLFMGLINVMFGAVFAVIGAIIGRKFLKSSNPN